jgi:hypothetical protein
MNGMLTLFKVQREMPGAGETAEGLLQTNLDSNIADAINEGNPDKMTATLNAVASTMGSPLTCKPDANDETKTCATYNRNPCPSLPDLCGACMEGYTTPFGPEYIDNGMPCTLISSRRRLAANGASCSSNSDCDYNYCENGVCDMPPKTCPTIVTGSECSGNGTCAFIDLKANPVMDCRLGDADCFAYCQCNVNMTGAACHMNNATSFARDTLIASLCENLLTSTQLKARSASTLADLLSSIQTTFEPFDVRAPGLAKCKEAITYAYGLIDDGYIDADADASVQENAAASLSSLVDAHINMRLINATSADYKYQQGVQQVTSAMDIPDVDTSYIMSNAQLLQQKVLTLMSSGQSPVTVLSDHIRFTTYNEGKDNLKGAVLSPPKSTEQSTYGHKMVEIELPADGLSRCSSDNFIPFGLMEYGIMPVKDSNHSGVRDVEGELVQLTLPKASTAPEFGVYSRYNVSVHFQEPIEFNISYPFEGFNRTFPVLYTSDVIDGSNFIMQNCNATTFTNDNATFDCPDFGRLCTDMTDNSGYVYTLDGNDYMVNTMSGGKYFLQGIYTSAPTGQPTGQPTGEPTSIPSGEPTGQPTSIPSGEPTATPSSAPSAVPTSKPSGQPSSKPTGEPTSIPSGEPTSKPSSIPSGEPTTTPSSAPSAAPTSIPTSPTGQPSAEPTGKPSGGPTSQPSRQGPSSRPTSQPTPNPTSIPTMIPTKAIAYAVEVAVSQELRAPGLNSTSFMAADSVKAFKLAVANITAVLPKDVDIESVTDVMSSRRRLLLSRQLQASVVGVSVNYSIEISISDPSNTADINNAVSSVTNSLQTATNTSSGTSAFQTALVQAAQSTGSTLVTNIFSSVNVSTPTVTEGSVQVYTKTPSGAPTSAPTGIPKAKTADGPPIIIIIVVVIVVALSAFGAFFYHQNTQGNKAQQYAPRSGKNSAKVAVSSEPENQMRAFSDVEDDE